jgi:hypothetical protein
MISSRADLLLLSREKLTALLLPGIQDLSCPLFQGDSLHETSAKAASVGASRRPIDDDELAGTGRGLNEARYQRMWLSKITRTGYLFPEESRPAMSSEGFTGFGGVIYINEPARFSQFHCIVCV